MKTAEELRSEILRLSREYTEKVHADFAQADERSEPRFEPGVTPVPYAGRVFNGDEVQAAVSSALDFWLTLGPIGASLERDFAKYLGVRNSALVNSGSSANLVALSALTSHLLGERRIRVDDEVITAAAGFPTTVAPIIQNGCVPVFIDSDPITGNIDVGQLSEAYVEGKTKAVMVAHTLGNPFNIHEVKSFCEQHNLWLVEDNCDALGSTYRTAGSEAPRLTGSFGDLSTQSFYPPHHMTMGEGGAVNIVSDARLKVIVESFRDWGRDCWCASGKDNTCGQRFSWELGTLPQGYDHKYIYSHLGYNLKPLELQAAIGGQQLRKLPGFVKARQRNWDYLRSGLAGAEEFFHFSLPTHATAWSDSEGFSWDDTGNRVECSWFGFMILIRPTAPFSRVDLARTLDNAKIGNRMLFGGNLSRQPAFIRQLNEDPKAFRSVGNLEGADRLMNDALFVGVYPGLSQAMLDHIISVCLSVCARV